MQPVVVAVTSWSLWRLQSWSKRGEKGSFALIDGWYPSMTWTDKLEPITKPQNWYWWFSCPNHSLVTTSSFAVFLVPSFEICDEWSEMFEHQLGWDVSATALERHLMPTMHKHNLPGCATMPWTLLRRSYRAYPAKRFHVARLGDFAWCFLDPV